MKAKARKSTKSPDSLLEVLQDRFEKNVHRHVGVTWKKVLSALQEDADSIRAIQRMQDTGGEPDVIGQDLKTGQFLFCDCSAESPDGRRSLCYDQKALNSRKEHKPSGSVIEMAREMGIELLTEQLYRSLQELGEFDLKTSSWVTTPDSIRALGGALFCDRRYDQVFVYHNGAQSYYGSRGFRGIRRV